MVLVCANFLQCVAKKRGYSNFEPELWQTFSTDNREDEWKDMNILPDREKE
jgi:hypothetical protein